MNYHPSKSYPELGSGSTYMLNGLWQKTIRHSIKGRGIGLHTGKLVNLCLHPAPKNTGVIFRRTDVRKPVEIPATVDSVTKTLLSTTIGNGEVSISTVEHILSAIFGMGIDNLYIDVDADEIPILDGSSQPFVFMLQAGGMRLLKAPKRCARIKKHIRVRKDEKWLECHPYEGLKVSITVQFDHPALGEDVCTDTVDFSESSYVTFVSRARTFGFLRDCEKLRKLNLGLGGNFNNTVIFDDEKVLNEGGLRYFNECVKHKILDFIGDVFLFNRFVLGSFVGYKSGHELNNMLLRRMIEEPNALEDFYLGEDDFRHTSFHLPHHG